MLANDMRGMRWRHVVLISQVAVMRRGSKARRVREEGGVNDIASAVIRTWVMMRVIG
jgi:hypothetical protein